MGKDVYANERRRAKAVTFGIAYSLTAYGLSRQLTCSKEEGQEMIDSWYRAYPEVKQWKEDVMEHAITEAERTGEMPFVATLRGRWRRLKDLDRDLSKAEMTSKFFWRNIHLKKLQQERRLERAKARRQATNSPIQGGSADIILEAM